jgi:Ser/Thr protein kinase RdoA (MazF antagonist)
VIGHLDASPWNAVWAGGALVGFVDWDTAGPSRREDDLAFSALTWVPLLAAEIAGLPDEFWRGPGR